MSGGLDSMKKLHLRGLFFGVAVAALASLSSGAAWAEEAAPMHLELNKLESLPQNGGCRVYFVINNQAPETLSQFRLDMILFGNDGVILKRVALDLGPLPAKRTAVRLFDLQGTKCEDIGRMLVNDVLACQKAAQGGAQPTEIAHDACLDRLSLSSRAKAELSK